VGQEASWKDRAHILAVAASAMRHLLIDYARRRHAAKRGGYAIHVSLGDVTEMLSSAEVSITLSTEPVAALLDFERALNALSLHDTRFGEVVECRVFGGLTVKETATALNLSSATVDRIWAKARAYLQIALSSGEETTP
jgi:RNA polymerase sigma factor (TIGR02999 family)